MNCMCIQAISSWEKHCMKCMALMNGCVPDEHEWYLEGAFTEEWGLLRSARLSRKTKR